MNKKIKAVLLSSLVFPGAGQFLLKKYLLGSILSGMALVSLCVILVNIVERTLQLAEQLQQGEIPLDTITISSFLLEQHSTSSSPSIVSIASIVLVLAWTISIIDSFVTKL